MVVYLNNNRGDYASNLKYPYFSLMLSIARQFGWEPDLFFDHSFGDPMKYFSNGGRNERSTDAHKVADALEKFISDIPDSRDSEKCKNFGTIGELKELVKEYIYYFRQGEFQKL
jgi:hypothetical protein